MTLHSRQLAAKTAAEHGLYVPSFEHDSCGVGFVADVQGRASHRIVSTALDMLQGLKHRGAVGSDPLTGDGCGMLLQIPDRLLRETTLALPPAGSYGVGMAFVALDQGTRSAQLELIERAIEAQALTLIDWREVPVDDSVCGPVGLESKPHAMQFFVADRTNGWALERRLYVLRKVIEELADAHPNKTVSALYICSLSSRTIVYKGLLVPDRLAGFYLDLANPVFESAVAMTHQRFSTNTFPSWERAHPYRMIAHNGEINTLRGNINAMRTRERLFESPTLGSDIDNLRPVIDPRGSDSAMFDNVLELLTHTGRSLAHAGAMMIPPAWETDARMPDDRRAFYRFHASLMEPWDGPALITFSDGVRVGACLDRNGLRPARYLITDDDLVILASEAGAVDIAPAAIAHSGRLGPGQMLMVDTLEHRVLRDRELKQSLCEAYDYPRWTQLSLLRLERKITPHTIADPDREILARSQRLFGYTHEDLRLVLGPMADRGAEPLGAMGDDSALAVLSELPQPLFNYFKQLFAQVTNPPIDPIRESGVMSLRTLLGPQANLFDLHDLPHHIVLESPVLTDTMLGNIRDCDPSRFPCQDIDTTYYPHRGGLRKAVEKLRQDATRAVRAGARILVLSDRKHDAQHAPMPSLLAVAAVHQHLIRSGLRHSVSIVADSGEPREVMHICLLLGYGASAVNPYLAFQSLMQLQKDGELRETDRCRLVSRYISALDKGILKVLSKMGISTLQSYIGAQIFEAVGLGHSLIDEFFPNTVSRLGGIDLELIEQDYLSRIADDLEAKDLEWGGRYKWRRDGERHQWTPNVVGLLQHGVRSGDYKVFKKYTRIVDNHTTRHCDVRGLLDFVSPNPPIDTTEVESVAEIVKRFRTGAMSFGSLSQEAHETLAEAMNQLGGRSNSGEGGEDPKRYARFGNRERNSAIKQVASGRFGVTPAYLLSADEIQIKMAQGAKPGEGGQLPGHKVDAQIAAVRHSTPGVGLISPPPHHDIYSIEDLAQLIFDLKNVNERAQVSVKLVSEVGVGTVAAGVAKAKADRIVISGHSGGTGASPLSSIKHAGLPWELGLAEAQQVLVANGLRASVSLETDGQLKTGRDVVIAALLGADNFGFGTAALIASGCILMRVCHRNTCPVGIATQDPDLRKHFQGTPDHVMNFMLFVAEEVREILAQLGVPTIAELIGRADFLKPHESVAKHRKARFLDLHRLLHVAKGDTPIRHSPISTTHPLDDVLDRRLIRLAEGALLRGERVEIATPITNADRSAATLLSSRIVTEHGESGLPEGTINLVMTGSAGQSLGAFLAPGIDICLHGAANDSLAKGMAGGFIRVLAQTPKDSPSNIVAGNVALYGATRGTLFLNGRAGERFAVRNSGATAVVEGLGAHGCEYMTGGRVVVLGSVGPNFGAGMSGGLAFVFDEHDNFIDQCNLTMVDIEPLSESDEPALYDLIERFVERTSSEVGTRIFNDWANQKCRFVKVIPKEYRQALLRSIAPQSAVAVG